MLKIALQSSSSISRLVVVMNTKFSFTCCSTVIRLFKRYFFWMTLWSLGYLSTYLFLYNYSNAKRQT